MSKNTYMGQKFREIRRAKKINIYDACEKIISESSLQRWESGEGKMPIEKVMDLLNRIHVQPKEFIDEMPISSFQIYVSNVATAYENENAEQLKNMLEFEKSLHYLQPQDKDIFQRYVIACNFYMDLTGENLLSDEDLLRLKAYLTAIDHWHQENVLMFADTLLLLPAEDISKVARSLLSYLIDTDIKRRFGIMSINALLNAVFALIKNKEVELANKLLNQIQKINLSFDHTSESLRIKFMSILFNYLKTKDITEFNNFLVALNSTGLQDKMEDFRLGFLQVKEIYSY